MLLIDIDAVPMAGPPSLAATLFTAEAAKHMLGLFHSPFPPATVGSIRYWNHKDVRLEVRWTHSRDPHAAATHANLKDTAEHGAYGVAIGIMRALGYKVLGRAHQGSGADWLLLREGEDEENHIRLEVHGTATGVGLDARLERKVRQLNQRPGPGFALVVRFQDACVLTAWVQ